MRRLTAHISTNFIPAEVQLMIANGTSPPESVCYVNRLTTTNDTHAATYASTVM